MAKKDYLWEETTWCVTSNTLSPAIESESGRANNWLQAMTFWFWTTFYLSEEEEHSIFSVLWQLSICSNPIQLKAYSLLHYHYTSFSAKTKVNWARQILSEDKQFCLFIDTILVLCGLLGIHFLGLSGVSVCLLSEWKKKLKASTFTWPKTHDKGCNQRAN